MPNINGLQYTKDLPKLKWALGFKERKLCLPLVLAKAVKCPVKLINWIQNGAPIKV